MRMNANQAVNNIEARENSKNFKTVSLFKVDVGQSKRVIPLFRKAEDAEFYSVHAVKMISKNGKEYTVDVDCLGSNCPLCAEALKHTDVKYPAIPQVARKSDALYMSFITVTLNDKGEYEFEFNPWKRYSTFYKNTLYPFYMRYAGAKMLEIERVDAKTYNLYEARTDEKGNPYPEFDIEKIKKDLEYTHEDIYGRMDSVVKVWDAQQMMEYIETHQYPKAVASSVSEENVKQDESQAQDVKTSPQATQEATVRPRVKHSF